MISGPTNPTFVELLYVDLISTFADTPMVYLQLTLNLIENGIESEVLQVNTDSFPLPPGFTRIDRFNAFDLLLPPWGFRYSGDYLDYVLLNAALPPGSYELCIQVFSGTSMVGQRGCRTLSVAPTPTFVNLMMPQNQSMVTLSMPVFSWTKSGGSAGAIDPDGFYQIKIVNLLEGQSPAAAMDANPVIFLGDGIGQNMLQYPITSQPLLPCSSYAWQVEAYKQANQNPRAHVAWSEIWSLTMGCGSGGGGPGGDGGPWGGPGGGGGSGGGTGGGNGGGSGGGGNGNGGPGGNGTGGGTGGGSGNCIDCDSLLCKNYIVELHRKQKDTLRYYQVWVENKYAGNNQARQPKAFYMKVLTDSVRLQPDSTGTTWNLVSGPSAAKVTQEWASKQTKIGQGKFKAGVVALRGKEREAVAIQVVWKNRNNQVICKDTLKVYEPCAYYDLDSRAIDAPVELTEHKLNVQFTRLYQSGTGLSGTILDLQSGKALNPVRDPFQHLTCSTGLNRLKLDLHPYTLEAGKVYLLELSTGTQKFRLPFKMKTP